MKDDAQECPENGEVTTAFQDKWIEIAQGVQKGLCQRVKTMEHMTAEQMADFMECLQDAFWFTVNAHAFDKSVELAESRSPGD